MSWLSDTDLVQKIQRNGNQLIKSSFHGVFPIDTLPESISNLPFTMVVNMDAHNLPGSHWIAVYIDEHKRGEIFDSLALPTSLPLAKWMNQFTVSWRKNSRYYQHLLSSHCGAFVIYFVLMRPHVSSIEDVTKTFTSSLYENESLVLTFFNCLK